MIFLPKDYWESWNRPTLIDRYSSELAYRRIQEEQGILTASFTLNESKFKLKLPDYLLHIYDLTSKEFQIR